MAPRVKFRALICALTVFGLIGLPAGPAAATHGPACLDVTPETDRNPTGTPHVLTATLRNPGAPPASPTACSGSEVTREFPVHIDFEITSGPNDPDGGDSPLTPDLSCTIQPGSSSCSEDYTGNNVGTDVIRGWIDEDGNDATYEGDSTEGRDETTTPGTSVELEPDDTDVVQKTWTASQLDCEPEEAGDASAGEDQTFTCTARDADGDPASGQNVDIEFRGANDPDDGDSRTSPDESCTTDANGQCTFTHSGGDAEGTGRTEYVAWVDNDNSNSTDESDPTEGRDEVAQPGRDPEPDNTDVVAQSRVAAAPARLDCDDQTGDDAETNLQGEDEIYTCTVQDEFGNPVANTPVDGENMSGTNTGNDPDDDATGGPESTADYSCATATDANGRCTVTVSGAEGQTGSAPICFWIDSDNDNLFDVAGAEDDGGDCEDGPPAEGEFGPPASEAGQADEPENNDETDKVRKTWSASSTGDISGGTDAQPESATNELGDAHTVTITVYDQFGQPSTSRNVVRVEFFMGSPRDSDGNTPNSPDDSCTTTDPSTPETSTCAIRYRAPDQRAGRDLLCVWIGDRPPVMVGDNTNGLCDGEGRQDATSDDGPPTPSNDRVDVVEKFWYAPFLDCEPEQRTRESGTQHTVTCTATNRSGEPVSGQNVDAEASGNNDPDNGDTRDSPDFTCTTDESGNCSFNHTGSQAGQTTYTAWADRDQNNATSEAVSEPRDAPERDNGTDVVTVTWTPSRLDCEPETDSNPVGDQHTITCTARDASGATASGVRIDGEATGAGDPDNNSNLQNPDFNNCVTGSDGTCQINHSSNETGTTMYRFWIDDDDDNSTADADTTEGRDADSDPPNPAQQGERPEPDDTDVVDKNWIGPGLDCTPETDTNPTGTTHEITCTLRDSEGRGVSGAQIDGEATGAGDPDGNSNLEDPDFTCAQTSADDPNTEADEGGVCRFTHTSGEPGATVYRFWVDTDGSNSTAEADDAEARDETTPVGRGDQAEPDNTDVVEKTWTTLTLDCEPETDSNPTGSSHTITCEAADTRGLPLSNTNIDAEATGANDPDGTDSPETPDFMCTTDRTGVCSFTHGPGSSSPGAQSTSEAGQTLYRAWIDADGDHSADPPTHGAVEADRSEGRNQAANPGSKTEPDDTDVVEKNWLPQHLNCEPETDSNPTGSAHTVTCTVTTQSGDESTPVEGSEVDAEATGANDPDNGDSQESPDFTCTTDEDGQCTFTHGAGGSGRTSDAGTTTYRAWVDSDKSDATSEADRTEGRDESAAPGSQAEPDGTDVVEKTWQAPPIDCAPEIDSNPVGTAHTVVCSAEPNTNIDIEATGANDPDGGDTKESPDFTCRTSNQGSCTFTHGQGGSGTTSQQGTTVYRAWIDRDGNHSGNQQSHGAVEADSSEGRNESTQPGSQPEPDDTDVVEKNWTREIQALTLTPESDAASVGTCNAFTITATDSAGRGVSGVIVDVEQRHERSANTTPNDEPAVSFCVPRATDGPNPSGVDQTQGDLDPPEENPDNRGTLGGRTQVPTDQEGRVTIGIRVQPANNSDGTGTVTLTAFLDTDDDEDPDQNERQDSSAKTWVTPAARTIDCSPEEVRRSTGTEHTVTCVVTDRFGEPLQGQQVTFSEDGPGGFTTSSQATTDGSGRASVTASSDDSGTQTIVGTLAEDTQGNEPEHVDDCDRSAGDPAGAPAGSCSDSVTVMWTGGQETDCPSGREGDNVIVGSDDDDVLTGTEGRDVICAGGGDDLIDALGGDDIVIAGDGADTVSGGDGDDDLQGGADRDAMRGDDGNDELSGGGGKDNLRGNDGRDRLSGGSQNDILSGGADVDVLSGNGGFDTIKGNADADIIDGQWGEDILQGGSGRDILRGRLGNDLIKGGGGRDRLFGHAGNDVLDGGPGRDRCAGGRGNNTFRRCE